MIIQVTITDKPRFLEVYAALCSAFREKVDKADVKVYYEILSDLPIEAVSGSALRIMREGSVSGWMPRAPEWYSVAAELDIDREIDASRSRKLLPSHEQRERDMKAITEAKAEFVEQCREVGAVSMAEYFEQLEVRHPSENPESHVCEVCGDTGKVFGDDGRWGVPCACAGTNPVLRRKARKAKRAALLRERERRAMEMNPARHGGMRKLVG